MGIDSPAESGPARLLTDVAEPLRDREAFIGRQLAELMGVRAGDEVAIVGQGVDGSLANDLFTVRGGRRGRGQRHHSAGDDHDPDA